MYFTIFHYILIKIFNLLLFVISYVIYHSLDGQETLLTMGWQVIFSTEKVLPIKLISEISHYLIDLYNSDQ